jgi:hypothetical protein
VKRIRIDRPRVRHDRPWREVLPPTRETPDVVRAKALARAGNPRQKVASKLWPLVPRARSASARRQDLRQVAGNGTAASCKTTRT